MNNSHHSKEDYPFNEVFDLIREIQKKIDKIDYKLTMHIDSPTGEGHAQAKIGELEERINKLYLKEIDLGTLMSQTGTLIQRFEEKLKQKFDSIELSIHNLEMRE